nr:FHA domain-containing protein [Planktothrix sp. FACHB-1355]
MLHPSQSTPVQSWTFGGEPLIRIGRSKDNDVVLYSAVVSRNHVELWNNGTDWEIISFGANGTYVDNEPITQRQVVDGMIFRLGSSGPKIQVLLGKGDPNAIIKKTQEERSPSPSADTEASPRESETYLTTRRIID